MRSTIKTKKTRCGLAIEWNGSRISEKCEFLGDDFKSMRSDSSRLCGYRCRKEPKCTHFTWMTKDENTCYLKQNKSISENDAYANENSQCGLLAEIHAEFMGI